MITNPTQCAFDPATVQCPAGADSSGTCLTAAQVRTARNMYDGVRDPAGQKVWPGLPPGSEPFWGPLTNPNAPFPIAVSYYRWVVFGDPNWDWKAFDLANPNDWARHLDGERKYAPVLSAVDPNLRAFKARGGKLIPIHGWSDQLISAQNSIDYYESVLAFERGGGDRATTFEQCRTSIDYSWRRACFTAPAVPDRIHSMRSARSRHGSSDGSHPTR